MEVPLRLLVDALVKVNIVGVGVGVSYGGTYYTLLRSSLGIEMMMMMMVTMTMVTMMMTMTMLIRMAMMMMLIRMGKSNKKMKENYSDIKNMIDIKYGQLVFSFPLCTSRTVSFGWKSSS